MCLLDTTNTQSLTESIKTHLHLNTEHFLWLPDTPVAEPQPDSMATAYKEQSSALGSPHLFQGKVSSSSLALSPAGSLHGGSPQSSQRSTAPTTLLGSVERQTRARAGTAPGVVARLPVPGLTPSNSIRGAVLGQQLSTSRLGRHSVSSFPAGASPLQPGQLLQPQPQPQPAEQAPPHRAASHAGIAAALSATPMAATAAGSTAASACVSPTPRPTAMQLMEQLAIPQQTDNDAADVGAIHIITGGIQARSRSFTSSVAQPLRVNSCAIGSSIVSEQQQQHQARATMLSAAARSSLNDTGNADHPDAAGDPDGEAPSHGGQHAASTSSDSSKGGTSSSSSSFAKCAGGLLGPRSVFVLERVQSGFLGATLSRFGITGLYISFVYGIGRFLRLSVADLRLRIPTEDLPSTRRLVMLCHDIYVARAEGAWGLHIHVDAVWSCLAVSTCAEGQAGRVMCGMLRKHAM